MGLSPFGLASNTFYYFFTLYIILSEQFKMIVKQSLVSMVESVLICSGVSTVTVLGLDTLETFVKSKVCISMTNILPSSHSQYLSMHS